MLATDACARGSLAGRAERADDPSAATARLDWGAAEELVAGGLFDSVLASDVLYEPASVALLTTLV